MYKIESPELVELWFSSFIGRTVTLIWLYKVLVTNLPVTNYNVLGNIDFKLTSV